MECVDVQKRALENARDPVRDEVYALINKKISSHANVSNGNFKVKYYIPSQFEWELKMVERRKTVDGEEKLLQESHVECPDLDWLVSELREKKYTVTLKQEKGYLYGRSGFLEIRVE